MRARSTLDWTQSNNISCPSRHVYERTDRRTDRRTGVCTSKIRNATMGVRRNSNINVYNLDGGHDPEGEADARHLLCLVQRVGGKVGVIDGNSSRRSQQTEVGRRRQNGARVVVDERRTVLVQ